jgi:hypothetical protein
MFPVSKKRKVHTLTMNGFLKPPLLFRPIQEAPIPKPDAIYIEAFDEIFTEIEDTDEILSLLENIERLACKYEMFIEGANAHNVQDLIEGTQVFLGFNSKIETHLKEKVETKATIEDFINACREDKFKTIYIGGVYGRACAWNMARRIAKNIRARILPDYHPNVRFYDIETDFQFENAIMKDSITEGHFKSYDPIFYRYFMFSPLKIYRVSQSIVSDYEEEKLIQEKPQATGASYQKYFGDNTEDLHDAMLAACQKKSRAK